MPLMAFPLPEFGAAAAAIRQFSPSASATACSRCERLFSSAGLRHAGSCSTCPDGEALCQNCFNRHTSDPRFVSHAYRAIGEEYAGASLLARLGLVPALKACVLHGQPFLDVRCKKCATPDSITPCKLCALCINEHARAHPAHALVPFAPDVSGLRSRLRVLVALSSADGDPAGDVAGAAPTAAAAPLIASARRRARAAHAGLGSLAAREEAALAQLGENRDALLAAVEAAFREGARAVHAASAAKHAALQEELEVADAALAVAEMTTAALTEAADVLDDADMVQHSEALFGRFAAAQAAVAAVPELPVTSSFLAVEPAQSASALHAAAARLLGEVLVAQVVGDPQRGVKPA